MTGTRKKRRRSVRFPGIGIGRLGFVLLGLFLAVGLGGCDRNSRKRPHVILLTADTLRADHLGFYGYERPVSPRLDALAENATVFLDSTSTANSTNPSFASILTGAYVKTHGVISLATFGYSLNQNLVTLAELFKEEGYLTIASVSAHHMAGELSGFGQGFDYYFDVDDLGVYKQRARKTNANVYPLLEEAYAGKRKDDRPVFLWMHYFDPHTPYQPDDASLQAALGGDLPPSSAAPESKVALYDGEIRSLDGEIGKLLDFFVENDLFNDTLIAFSADHGENLGEKEGLFANHFRLFRPVVHVPLLIKEPGQKRGRRVAGAAQSVDLYPTLAELALGRAPASLSAQIEGESLVPLIRGRKDEVRDHVFSEGASNKERMLRSSTHKLVHDVRRDRYELYDLVADPGENRNLAGQDPTTLNRLRRELARFVGPQRIRLSFDPLPPRSGTRRFRGWLDTTTDLSLLDPSGVGSGDEVQLVGRPARRLELDLELTEDRGKEVWFEFGGGPLVFDGDLGGRPLQEEEVSLCGVPFAAACLLRIDVGAERVGTGENSSSSSSSSSGTAPAELELRVSSRSGEGDENQELLARLEFGASPGEEGKMVSLSGRFLSDGKVRPVESGGEEVRFFAAGENRQRFRARVKLPFALEFLLSPKTSLLVFQAFKGVEEGVMEAISRERIRISGDRAEGKITFFLPPDALSSLDLTRREPERGDGWGGIRFDLERSEWAAEWDPVDPENMDRATRERLEQLGYLDSPEKSGTSETTPH